MTEATRELIEQAAKSNRRVQAVDMPELGEGVVGYVREVPSDERDRLVFSIDPGQGRPRNTRNVTARWAALYWSDAEGRRLFADDQADVVGKLPVALIERIFKSGQKFNGQDEEGDEDIKKNSPRTQSDSSGSDSPSSWDAP